MSRLLLTYARTPVGQRTAQRSVGHLYVRRLVAVVAAGLVLTGCGPDAKPTAPGTPTPSTVTPTPKPTPKPLEQVAPVLPEAAKADTKAGAVAFVRHYVNAVNHAMQTGDVAYLRSLSRAGCDSCHAIETAIAKIERHGGRSRGGEWRIAKIVSVFQNSSVLGWLAIAQVQVGRHLVWPTNAAKPLTVPAESRLFNFQVGRTSDRWEVTRWTRAY